VKKAASKITIIFICSAPVLSQNFNLTFTGTGQSSTIDSIRITNLHTNESLSIPGDESLVLDINTGVENNIHEIISPVLYPNPFINSALIGFYQPKPGNVIIKSFNLTGQSVLNVRQYLDAGTHSFSVSFGSPGIYLISIISNNQSFNCKAVCRESTEERFQASLSESHYEMGYKSGFYKNEKIKSGKSISYSREQILLFKCYSGVYTSVITDKPYESKDYEIEFFDCTDPHGKTYSTVVIGDQVWMEENLAWIPYVSEPDSVSNDSAQYFVWGYYGRNPEEARKEKKYIDYGVLYNYQAAKNACPSGWHLPTDEEFTSLSNYLKQNGYAYEGSGDDIGKALASRKLWLPDNSPGNVGNDVLSNNYSGFNALPGGGRYEDGEFHGYLNRSHFWTLTGGGNYGWGRYLNSDYYGFYRLYYQRTYAFSVRCLKN
jgi:uncharacterized protein (TIGR02145 family)